MVFEPFFSTLFHFFFTQLKCLQISHSRLDYFLVFFQHYYWFKKSDPIFSSVENTSDLFPILTDHYFKECLLTIRPKLKLYKSYEQAKEEVEKLQQELYPRTYFPRTLTVMRLWARLPKKEMNKLTPTTTTLKIHQKHLDRTKRCDSGMEVKTKIAQRMTNTERMLVSMQWMT